MTIFDRYLYRRFFHVFAIMFLAMYGLYVVVDVFTNPEDFLERPGSSLQKLVYLLQFYGYRLSEFFGMLGGTVCVLSVMTVLALVQRCGELNPILAAGIPTYRVVRPLIIASVIISGLLVANQELVIPRIATFLQIGAGKDRELSGDIEPVYDFATQVLLTGKQLKLREREVLDPEFVLPVPLIVEELTTIKGKSARYIAGGPHGDGWLVRQIDTPVDAIRLTERGKKTVHPGADPSELFVVTDVQFDRLYKGSKSYEYLSTLELLRRVKNPSFGAVSLKRQSLLLHSRLTKPVMNVLVVLLGIPFVAMRESRSLIVNMGACALVLGGAQGLAELCQYLARANMLGPDLAVWIPLIITATACAWLSALTRS